MKPCGKKKPESQKEFGAPFVNQSCINATLSKRSLYQVGSGFKEGYATFSQFFGT